MSTLKPATDMLSQLSNVLPTGTFLVFQILAPLATNNGNCGHVEVVLTSVTLILLGLLCVASSFSDSYKASNGMVYYGFVTPWGLWNPNFRRVIPAGSKSSYYKGPQNRYVMELDDFVTAAISVVALTTISLLTSPVTTCFYPNISESILKTVPILVGLGVAAVCAFGTTPRNGLGFAGVTPKTGTAPSLSDSEAPPHAEPASDSPPDQKRSDQQV